MNEVKSKPKMRTVKSLLAIYHVDQEFLNAITPKTKHKEINKILIEYDIWLNKKKRSLNDKRVTLIVDQQ